jgi:hypothetical protein
MRKYINNKKIRRLTTGGKGPYKSPDCCLRNWLSRKYKMIFHKISSKGGWWD